MSNQRNTVLKNSDNTAFLPIWIYFFFLSECLGRCDEMLLSLILCRSQFGHVH